MDHAHWRERTEQPIEYWLHKIHHVISITCTKQSICFVAFHREENKTACIFHLDRYDVYNQRQSNTPYLPLCQHYKLRPNRRWISICAASANNLSPVLSARTYMSKWIRNHLSCKNPAVAVYPYRKTMDTEATLNWVRKISNLNNIVMMWPFQ